MDAQAQSGGNENADTTNLKQLQDCTTLRTYCSSASMSLAALRQEIRRVQNDISLPDSAKAKIIQSLMTTSWRESQMHKPNSSYSLECSSSLGESQSSNKQSTTSSERSKNRDLGCQHYQRGALISAPCCNLFFPCRFCHDTFCDHKIDRYAINRFKCIVCDNEQEPSKNCERCGASFAKYYCSKCKFLDDDPNKSIYHCDRCNLCRIGKGLGIDYFHCDKCNACMSITLKEHKCVERSLESNCPVCHEYMFTSTSPVMFLLCGHCMHVDCYDEYTKTNYVCPICLKSLGDMHEYFARIDRALQSEVMPEPYRNLENLVYCADCERRSVTKFHFLYHKCQICYSYNTRVIETLRKVP